MSKLYSGTSGFAYASWKPDFYPQKLAAKNFLQYYATLECRRSQLHFPSTAKSLTIENWVNATPEGFLFACKAHMRITHINRLKESEFNQLFFRAIEPLRSSRRLGPVLFQLPPNFKLDAPLLAASSKSCRKTSAQHSSFATQPG